VADDRRDTIRADRLLSALATVLLILPVILNPMTAPRSWAASFLLAAMSLVLLASRPTKGLPAALLWILLFTPLAAASVAAASCRSRGIDQAAFAVALLIAGFLGRGLTDGGGARRIMLVLTAGGSAASLHALLQRYVTYPSLAAALRASDPADPTGVLVRLEAGRPSGPFILPAALGGFLALAIPAALAWTAGADRKHLRVIGGMAVGLQIYALALSRSLGALAAAAVGVALVIPILMRRHRGPALVAILVAAVLGATLFVHLRRDEIFATPGGDPLALRAGNWTAAVQMVRERPLLGVGPGSFGTFYPRVMRAGMNETKYAHNSYLQAAAGWGVWILVPLMALLAAFVRATRRAWVGVTPSLPLLAAGGSFLFHNMFDFTAYLPAVAIPAALTLGAGLGGRPAVSDTAASRPRVWMFLAIGAAVGLAGLIVIHGVRVSRASLLLQGAREAGEAGQLDRATDLGRAAVRARREDPAPQAFLAQFILAHRMDEPALRLEGERAAASAIGLDPESAVLHYTRALYHRAAGEAAAAYREQYVAHRLHPLNPLYDPIVSPEEAPSR
jgi:putative inorganic carbon (HCO3(-)) transporter